MNSSYLEAILLDLHLGQSSICILRNINLSFLPQTTEINVFGNEKSSFTILENFMNANIITFWSSQIFSQRECNCTV